MGPRFFARGLTSSNPIPASAVTIAGVAATIPVMGPNDGIWWESLSGSFTGSVGTAVVTSIDSRFRDSAGNTLMHLFQPTVTTLNLALTGSAAFQFIPVLPLLQFSDIMQAQQAIVAAGGTATLSQPFTLQVVFTYTNGSVANNVFSQEFEVLGRLVQGIEQ